MKKTDLRSYARLIARMGINVQKNQEVIIAAGLDQPEFVAMVVDECYKAGAGKVRVEWSYQPLTKLNVRHCKQKTLEAVEDWEIEKIKHRVKTLPATIYLDSDDPDGLVGINQKKYMSAAQKRSLVFKPFRNEMDNKYQWCIAAVPGKAWAKKLFPNDRASVAIEKLWQAILSCARAFGDGEQNWKDHNKDLGDRCAYLNSLGLDKLV